MTRRLHACLTCERMDRPRFLRRGLTRHGDRICSWCRRRGVRSMGGVLTVPISIRLPTQLGRSRISLVTSLVTTKDAAAPTRAELDASADFTDLLQWHDTDCACPSCSRDRIPGRHA